MIKWADWQKPVNISPAKWVFVIEKNKKKLLIDIFSGIFISGVHYETDADIYVYYCSKFGTEYLEALLSYKFANVVDFT